MSDEYEDRFMDGARARYHEKHVARGLVAVMAVPTLFSLGIGVAVLFTPAWPGVFVALFAATVLTVSTLAWSTMRTTVTTTHLVVQYGTLGPSVPLEAIESAEIVSLGAFERAAFGAKYRGKDGWSYISPGQERGVRVRWRQGAELRQILVGAENADALASAIEEGRRHARGEAVRARVELTPEGAPSEPEAEADDRRSERARERSARSSHD